MVVEYQLARVRYALRSLEVTSPNDEVATRSYAPLEFPTKIFPYVGAVEVPVPPLLIPRIPVMSDARLMSEVETAPPVAFKKPERFESVNEPAVRLVEEA